MTESTDADSPARPPFEFRGDWSSPVVGTAVHAGTELCDGLAPLVVLEAADRLREEDPFTDDIARELPALVVVHRSRFEVDLNRPRERAVYRVPADSWDLEVWQGGALDDDRVDASRSPSTTSSTPPSRHGSTRLPSEARSWCTTCTATTTGATGRTPLRSPRPTTPT